MQIFNMSKYILEIKSRAILLFANGFSVILVSYLYKEIILFVIIEPNLLINIKKSLETFYFIFTDVTEVFLIYFKLIIFLSLQILYVYSIYHFFIYLSPALFYFEYLYLRFILIFIFFTWIFLSTLSTNFFIPSSWNFFLSFQNLTLAQSFILHFEARLKEYVVFYISIYYFCAFYSQFFLFYLIALDYIKSNLQVIKRFRKICHYCLIVFSTMISPPDLFSQILISVILIFIYESLIFLFLLKNFTI